jgi:hypothetical protein
MASEPDLPDPYYHDPDHWGVSMAHFYELMAPCLDAAGVRSIAEVGAYAGDLTRVLLRWASGAQATVMAIDPAPQPGLVGLADSHPELTLVREASLEALPHISLPDAVVIDGDHNYYTVSQELALIAERAPEDELPLLLFHDVRWPHARRDDYFDIEQIPEPYRHPTAGEELGIFPGEADARPGGLPYPRSAAHEGGERNGVLTAVEDFAAAHAGVRFVVVPAFFGFGVAWHTDRPWSEAVSRLLEPYDRHPVLERLEENRVFQLAERSAARTELWQAQARLARQEQLLRRLLDSSAFSVAERLSRLRDDAGIASEQSVVSKDEIRRVLEDG